AVHCAFRSWDGLLGKAIIHAIQSRELESLLIHNQLLKEMKHNRGFRPCAIQEGTLTFAPTYKNTTSDPTHSIRPRNDMPVWCDRVLRRSRDPERAAQFNYQRNEATVSDHRTISAAFKVMVKFLRQDVKVRKKVEMGMGMGMGMVLLESAREFCVQRARTLI
ncbi:hypothetical protein EDC04DRAFT_2672381, partial [Pisolithus marmoratus]